VDQTGACLNCGAPLHGPFCSACGQRAMSAYPTVREMVSDAWQELSGYDGRFVRTFALLRKPGALTLDVLAGRRARYIAPVRLYLVASVLYFLLAAAIPRLTLPPTATLPNSDVKIDVMNGGLAALPAEQQKIARAKLQKAPLGIGVMILRVSEDPKGFQARMRETLPRVFFVLVPLFAAIVAVFYWRRRFSQHLVFALHLHTALFLALSAIHLTNLSGSPALVRGVATIGLLCMAVYAIMAFKRVYGDPLPIVVAKGVGIAVVYGVATLTAIMLVVVWTTLMISLAAPPS
jgi:hypothetical protein